MPTGIYQHRKHSEETKEKMSLNHRKHQTQETRLKISNAMKNEKHHKWKEDNTNKISLHFWVKKNKPKPECCEQCGEKRKLALANIKDHIYTRNPKDYKWFCYSCHKKFDAKCNFCGKNNTELKMCMSCNECYTNGFNKERFIRLLKNYYMNWTKDDYLLNIINRLAGDKLNGN